ncbi:hypothetical protein HN415_08705, partial [Candidatus Woesearchaeota archaeon]|nr:hypothetical protein [Candidatus Woesearchaeota archaeon]
MKKLTHLFAFLIIFATLVSAFSNAVPNFDKESIELSDLSNGLRTSKVNSQFKITNLDSTNVNIALSGLVLSNANGEFLAIELNGVNAQLGNFDANGQKSVDFFIDLSNNPTYGKYNGTIIATDSKSEQTLLPISLDISRNTQFDVKAITKKIVKGKTNTIEFEFISQSNYDTQVEINFNNLLKTSSFFPLDVEKKIILLNKSEVKNLSFEVFISNDLVSGLYKYDLNVDQSEFNFNKNYQISNIEVREKIQELTIIPNEIQINISGLESEFDFNFTVKNTGESNLENIGLDISSFDSFIEYSNFETNFALNELENKTFNIHASSSRPIDIDLLGEIKLSFNGKVIEADIKPIQRKMLRIDRVKVIVNDKSDRIRNSGERYSKDIKPGQDFSVEIKVCNDYDSNSDINIEDIAISAIIKDIDDGSDLDDDEKSDFTLSEDECEVRSVKFDKDHIPYDAEDKTFNMFINIEGRDDLDYFQEDNFTVKLKVDRKNHDLLFKKFLVTPTVVQNCFDNKAISLSALIFNIGDNDENGHVRFYSEQFNFESIKDFDIDYKNDNEFSAFTNFNFPNSASIGQYKFFAEVYRDNYIVDYKELDISLNDCSNNIQTDQDLYEKNLKLLNELNGVENNNDDFISEYKKLLLENQNINLDNDLQDNLNKSEQKKQ